MLALTVLFAVILGSLGGTLTVIGGMALSSRLGDYFGWPDWLELVVGFIPAVGAFAVLVAVAVSTY